MERLSQISKLSLGACVRFVKEVILLPSQALQTLVTLGKVVAKAVRDPCAQTILLPLAYCITGPILVAFYPVVATMYVLQPRLQFPACAASLRKIYSEYLIA